MPRRAAVHPPAVVGLGAAAAAAVLDGEPVPPPAPVTAGNTAAAPSSTVPRPSTAAPDVVARARVGSAGAGPLLFRPFAAADADGVGASAGDVPGGRPKEARETPPSTRGPAPSRHIRPSADISGRWIISLKYKSIWCKKVSKSKCDVRGWWKGDTAAQAFSLFGNIS